MHEKTVAKLKAKNRSGGKQMKKYVFFFFSVAMVINLICLDNALAKEKSSGKNTIKQSEAKSVKKQSNIEGLGIFKIGKTKISIIDDLESAFGTKSVVTSDSTVLYEGKSNTILQLVPKNKSGYGHPSICPDVKEYLIPVYNIADMQIKQLILNFYKDVLFEIRCDSSKELDDALKLKYGNPEILVTSEPISCVYKYTGNKVTYDNKIYVRTWENRGIEANSLFTKQYNDKCQGRVTHLFYIKDSKTGDIVDKCENYTRERYKSTEKQERLKKLNDL